MSDAHEPRGFHPGALVGSYRLVRKLGAGGMGVVFEAVHVETGAARALKCLPAADNEETLERFAREGQLQAVVGEHPNVVPVHSAGVLDGRPYLVMALLRGGDLAGRLRDGPLDPSEACRVVEAVAQGLEFVHTQGLVHRDLKPDNVLFDESGTPMLVDFGLARRVGVSSLTATGQVLGTPAYMAPEQVRGEPIGPATDVYGLGALLFACLTGRAPFVGASVVNVLVAVAESEPPRPSSLEPGVPERLDEVCLKALAKAPADRYPSALALAADLARVRAGKEPRHRVSRRKVVGRLVAAGAVATLVVGVSVSLGAWAFDRRSQAQGALELDALKELEGLRCSVEPNGCSGGSHAVRAWLAGAREPGAVANARALVEQIEGRGLPVEAIAVRVEGYERLRDGRLGDERDEFSRLLAALGHLRQGQVDEAVKLCARVEAFGSPEARGLGQVVAVRLLKALVSSVLEREPREARRGLEAGFAFAERSGLDSASLAAVVPEAFESGLKAWRSTRPSEATREGALRTIARVGVLYTCFPALDPGVVEADLTERVERLLARWKVDKGSLASALDVVRVENAIRDLFPRRGSTVELERFLQDLNGRETGHPEVLLLSLRVGPMTFKVGGAKYAIRGGGERLLEAVAAKRPTSRAVAYWSFLLHVDRDLATRESEPVIELCGAVLRAPVDDLAPEHLADVYRNLAQAQLDAAGKTRRDPVRLNAALEAARAAKRVLGERVWDGAVVLDAYSCEAAALARLGREDESVACWAELREYFRVRRPNEANEKLLLATGSDRHHQVRAWIFAARELMTLGRVQEADAVSSEAVELALRSMESHVIARAKGQRARYLRLSGRSDEVAAMLGAKIKFGTRTSAHFGAEAAYEAWSRGDVEEARRRLDYTAERHGTTAPAVVEARKVLFPD